VDDLSGMSQAHIGRSYCLTPATTTNKICIASLPLLYYTKSMNETLTVRLGKELADALQTEARESGLAKGEIARQALKARLGQKGGLPVMRRYFGVMGGPSDLSTNKAYRRTWNKKPA